MNKVLQTTRFVVENSKSVKINRDKITEFSDIFPNRKLSHWLTSSPIEYAHLNDKEKLNFLLVFNSTSFCYWGDPKWTIEHESKKYDGSWGMIAAIIRGINNGKPILDAGYRANITREDYQEILHGNVEIPLFEERWKITREIASTLLREYEGDFSNLVQKADGSGAALLELITAGFPSFEDVREYNGKRIYFYKRTQLLVEDIYQIFGGERYGRLSDIDQFTACADYKLPQSLRKLGIISYTRDLEKKIDNFIQIPANSPDEVEIRANTVWAVEMIKEKLNKSGNNIKSLDINDYLWTIGQIKGAGDKPYHRTRTTSY